jgi:hypothetical protein
LLILIILPVRQIANDVNHSRQGEASRMITSQRVIKFDNSWYVKTTTGYEGPFDDYAEAEVFLRLSQTVEAARMEFAGLVLTTTS